MIKELAEKLLPFGPEKIILFGSQAKGKAREESDIDLCIVLETEKKHRLIPELYCALDCDKPVDIIVYTPNEWEECVKDETSFAHKILTEGVVLYG
jgi:predicted nucleotidyltransferase